MAQSVLQILLNTKKTGTGDKEATAGLKDLNKQADATGKSFGSLGNIAKGAALVGVGALALGVKVAVDAALEAEVVMAKTEAVVKSTGGAAGLTAKQVADMAGEFSKMTGIDDELIQGAENVLLTFTAIGRDVFPQAMEAALNMSTALGTDLQGSIIQVGKALQDPIKGVTALRRVGVNFNAEAMKMIKTMVAMGDTAGAQAFILKELEIEFGGLAKAAGDTTAGKLNKAQVALENLAQAAGEKALPAIGQLATDLTRILDPADTAAERLAEIEEILSREIPPHVRVALEQERDVVIALAAEEEKLARIEQEEIDIKQHMIGAIQGQRGANEELIPTEEELAKAEEEAAKQAKEQAEALHKARDASADAAEGFFNLAQSYAEGVTKMDLVKTALDTIDEAQRSGLITDAERRASQEQIMLQFGLTTEAAISQARAQEELTRLYLLGKISEDAYLSALLLIPSAAKDGQVSMGELGSSVADASAKLGEAEDKARRTADAIRDIPDRTIRIDFSVAPLPNIPIGGAPIPFQHGGPIQAGTLAQLHSPEVFFPQGGFIQSRADTLRVIGLLEQLVAGMGRPNISFTTTAPLNAGRDAGVIRALAGAL